MADLLNSPEHSYQDQTHGYAEASKNAVDVLKSDVTRLERQAELSELELESLIPKNRFIINPPYACYLNSEAAFAFGKVEIIPFV